MDADDFCEILINGKKQDDMDKFFFRWCLLEAHNYGEPISFNDYLNSFKAKQWKPVKEIIAESNEIISQFNKGFEEVNF